MAEQHHPVVPSILRGLKHRCPQCGQGRLFRKYLKINETCETCGLAIARYPADDGPAYLTIILVGHMIVAPLLFFPWVWEAPAYITLPGILIPLTAVILAALPRVKGGWIGLMYALGVKDTEARFHTADRAE
ncbi:DUF983 domain-containing protein [Phenylobacterium sp.]|uniref:DUF983 domain-containing protein n=1 Tax=Phenylobacterium sp. TaxID=1871053 RepID=UPI003983482B